jgi:hypothetical protein
LMRLTRIKSMCCRLVLGSELRGKLGELSELSGWAQWYPQLWVKSCSWAVGVGWMAGW